MQLQTLLHIGVKNLGESCWNECHKKEGKCEWCGPEGYCCQKNYKSTNKHDVDCNGGAFGGKKQHECVPKYSLFTFKSHKSIFKNFINEKFRK